MRRFILFAAVAGWASLGAQTVSSVGRWAGVARAPGWGEVSLLVTLDSGATGWHGTLQAPSQTSETFTLVSVVPKGDSLILALPKTAQGAIFRLKASRDGKLYTGIVDIAGPGTVQLARADSPEATALLRDVTRVARSREAANRLAGQTPPASHRPQIRIRQGSSRATFNSSGARWIARRVTASPIIYSANIWRRPASACVTSSPDAS